MAGLKLPGKEPMGKVFVHYSDCDCGGWESMCASCQLQLYKLKHSGDPIREVYEKYKDGAGISIFHPEYYDQLETMRFDMWQAIKSFAEGKGGK